MARARSSLPVPVSPVIRTVMLLEATRRVVASGPASPRTRTRGRAVAQESPRAIARSDHYQQI